MAKPTVQTGAHSTLVYYWEDDGFKADPADDTPKTFGANPRLTAFDGQRNVVEMFEPNTRKVQQFLEQQFSGTFNVDFVYANPWFNRAVLHEPVTTDVNGSFEHEFHGEEPESIQVVAGNTRSGDDYLIRGVWVQDCSITINVPGNIEVSLSGAYGSLDPTTPDPQEEQVSEDIDPYTFAHAPIQLGAEVRRLVTQINITINNNTDPVLEVGSEEPVDFSPKHLALTVDTMRTQDDERDDDLERFLGGTSLGAPSRDEIVLTLDRGNGQQVVYEFADALANDFGFDNWGDPDQDIQASVTNRPVDVTCTATNDVETAP